MLTKTIVRDLFFFPSKPLSHVLQLASHAYIPVSGKAKCIQSGDNNAWMVLNIAEAIPT